MNTFNRRRSNHSSSAHLKEVKNGGKSRVKQGHYQKCSRWLLSDRDFPTTFKVLKAASGRTWTFDCDVTVVRYPVYSIELLNAMRSRVNAKSERGIFQDKDASAAHFFSFQGDRVMLHGTIRNDDFHENTALQCWNNVVTIRNNVPTLLQRCVALKIIIANRLV